MLLKVTLVFPPTPSSAYEVSIKKNGLDAAALVHRNINKHSDSRTKNVLKLRVTSGNNS